MGGAMMASVGTVLYAQSSKDKAVKEQMMWIHKSFGTLALGLLVPRILVRLTSKLPPKLPGSKIETMLGDLTHYVLYGFAIFLPVSGGVMGYYGGKGLPFFYTTIPGAEKPDGSIAKPAYQYHKLAGQAVEYVVPVHVAGAFFHFFKGQRIFSRILPLGK